MGSTLCKARETGLNLGKEERLKRGGESYAGGCLRVDVHVAAGAMCVVSRAALRAWRWPGAVVIVCVGIAGMSCRREHTVRIPCPGWTTLRARAALASSDAFGQRAVVAHSSNFLFVRVGVSRSFAVLRVHGISPGFAGWSRGLFCPHTVPAGQHGGLGLLSYAPILSDSVLMLLTVTIAFVRAGERIPQLCCPRRARHRS